MSATSDQQYNIRVRLDEDSMRRMQRLADNNRRSLAAEVRYAVDRYLEAQK